MDFSVVIVSFNTRDRLRDCLRAVFGSETKYSYEVFVVDNASRDGSAEMVRREFSKVKLVENKENLGYSKANNIAIKKILDQPGGSTSLPTSPHAWGEGNNSKYILLLNPDVVVSPDTFDKMISFMDNDSSVGISGCKVVKPDGSFDKASRRSFPNLRNSFFYFLSLPSDYNLDLPDDQVAEVDSVVGAFLLIRREAIDKIGLLDEDFFMYGEDLDWCMRAKLAGYKVMYTPITAVVHHKGSSSRKRPGKALYEFHRAMQIFYDKHYAGKTNFLVNYLVKWGIWARYALKAIQNMFRKDKFVSK